jgi:hypothetical protein
MRRTIFLPALTCMLTLGSCNLSPNSSAAQTWLKNYISAKSQSEFHILNFSITSSEEIVLGGVPSYRIAYTADVIFPDGNQSDCLLRLCMATDGVPIVLPHSTAQLVGDLIFQKATNKWVVASEWVRPPRISQIELGDALQCSQIADVISAAMRNDSRAASGLPNIMNPQEISRSESELQCRMQAELNGRSGTLVARAYEDGPSAKLAISRDQVSGTSSPGADTNHEYSSNEPSQGVAVPVANIDRRELERIEGEVHSVSAVPQEPARTAWVRVPEGYEPLPRPMLYSDPPVLNMYCSVNRGNERRSTSAHRCIGGWMRFSIPTASDLPPNYIENITYQLHKV